LAALLAQTESSAAAARATEIEVGVNSSHREAFRLLRDNGYRIDFLGVAMQSPDEPGYHRPEVTVLDDWR
jgi:hypothetical protein